MDTSTRTSGRALQSQRSVGTVLLFHSLLLKQKNRPVIYEKIYVLLFFCLKICVVV